MNNLVKKFFKQRIDRLNKQEDKDFLLYLEEDVTMTQEEQLKSLEKLKEIVEDDMQFRDVIRWRVLLKLTCLSIVFLKREIYEKYNRQRETTI